MASQSMATETSSPNSHTDEVSVEPIGHIKKFKLKKDDFSAWIKKFELYVMLNKFNCEKKKLMFLAYLGSKGYALITDLCAPMNPIKKDYDILKEMLSKHLHHPQHILEARRRFKERKQLAEETVGEFVMAMQDLAEDCDFGTSLKSSLTNQLINGVIDEDMRKRLLSENGLSYEKNVEICLALEDTKNISPLWKESTTNQKVSFHEHVISFNLDIPTEPAVEKGKIICFFRDDTKTSE